MGPLTEGWGVVVSDASQVLSLRRLASFSHLSPLLKAWSLILLVVATPLTPHTIQYYSHGSVNCQRG